MRYVFSTAVSVASPLFNNEIANGEINAETPSTAIKLKEFISTMAIIGVSDKAGIQTAK